MKNDKHVDRGLFGMAAIMVIAATIPLLSIAAMIGGFSPNRLFKQRDCRRGVADSLETDTDAHRRRHERALLHACSGPQAFWRCEVFDPWNGTQGCEGAAAFYLQAKRAARATEEQRTLRATMAAQCRFGTGKSQSRRRDQSRQWRRNRAARTWENRPMTTNIETSEPAPIPAVEDSRETCFQQGKPCVYAAPDDPGVIVTEWPNGTVDRKDQRANSRTRRWPDGTIETQPADMPPTFPHWPRPTA